jgi:hypothetical protein
MTLPFLIDSHLYQKQAKMLLSSLPFRSVRVVTAVLVMLVLAATFSTPAFSASSVTTIDIPGASFTGVLGINDGGQIVGAYDDATARMASSNKFGLDWDDDSGCS